MKIKNIFIAILFLILSPITALATTYYVDFQTGSDTNPGTTSSAPLKNVPVNLTSGDTVYLKRGVTYGGNISFSGNGTIKVYGVNATIAADGVTLTASGANFQTNGVVISDKIYLNGEGLFEISSIDTESQLTLATPTRHKSITDVEFLVAEVITITTTNWGNGPAIINGAVLLGGRDAILIDGGIKDGIEITPVDFGVYANSSIHRGIFLKNLNIHDINGDFAGIYLRNIKYALISSCYIHDIGNGDSSTGDDGIAVMSDSAYITIDNCILANLGDDGIHGAAMDKSYIQFSDISGAISNDAHSDGIAFNSTNVFEVTIRYNKIHDNASPTDWENVYFHVYYNLFYDTEPWYETGIGNMGIRYKRGAYGDIHNNIFAFNTLYAIYGYSDAGAPVNIQNNIFYENADSGTTNTTELSIANISNGVCKNNIYLRDTIMPDGDKIVAWGGTKYTLEEFQAIGQGQGSKYNDPGQLHKAWILCVLFRIHIMK